MMEERSLADVLRDHGISPDLLREPSFDRRRFIGALGGGIAVLMLLPRLAAQDGGRQPRGVTREEPTDIGGWLHISERGAVSAYVGKVELGQNARTTLSMVVAEELHIAPQAVTLVMADTAVTPFDIGTFGSRTTPYTVPPLRNAAAAARELLLDLAAGALGVDRGELSLADGQVAHRASGRMLSFGELTKGQDLVQAIPENVPVVPPEEWQVAGRPTPKLDGLSFVTGAHRFASDLKFPDMLHGKILRPAAVKARLRSLDSSAAEALPGVQVHRDGDFVGVIAPTDHEAEAALAALQAEWEPEAIVPDEDIHEHLRRTGGDEGRDDADIRAALDGAAIRLKQTYTVATIAHAAIEPRSAIAQWDGGDLTVWCSTQAPFGVRGGLAQMFGIPEARVRVIAPDTGNGYGGKTNCQPAYEAAQLARAAGRPVRVAWSREEEMARNHFRPAGVIEIESGLSADGRLVAWDYHNYNSGNAALDTPYDVPARVVRYHPCDSPLAQGAYRGLAAPANFFARETHIDELALVAGMDPLAFRLLNLSNDRLRAVLLAATERFGWTGAASDGETGMGLGCGIDKGGYTATCAQVRVDPDSGAVRVERIVTAFDCGAVLNPLQIQSQIEGAAVMAIGGALFEAVRYDNERILNPTFSTYRVPRFRDTPRIECVVVDRKDLPSAGAGETPFAGVAPAIGNAISHATGIRLRSLPMAPNGVQPPSGGGAP